MAQARDTWPRVERPQHKVVTPGLMAAALFALSCGSTSGVPTIATKDPTLLVNPRVVSLTPASGTHLARGLNIPLRITVVHRLYVEYFRLEGFDCYPYFPPGWNTKCIPFAGAPYHEVFGEGPPLLAHTTTLSGTLNIPKDSAGSIILRITWFYTPDGINGEGFTTAEDVATYLID